MPYINMAKSYRERGDYSMKRKKTDYPHGHFQHPHGIDPCGGHCGQYDDST